MCPEVVMVKSRSESKEFAVVNSEEISECGVNQELVLVKSGVVVE